MESFLEDQPVHRESRIYILRQVFLAFTCHLQAITGGCAYGMSSILLPQLQESQEIILTREEESWIASIPTLLLSPTVLLAGPIIEKFGRKRSMLYTCALTSVAWITVYSANSFLQLLIGRALCGIFIGQMYPTALSWMGEVTHPGIRAACLAQMTLGCGMGVLVIQLLGIYFHWKTISLILFAIPIYNFCAFSIMKESYVWNMIKGHCDEAKFNFFWYRGRSADARAELKAALDDNNTSVNNSLRKKIRLCLSKQVIIPFSLTCLLYFTGEFAGDTAIVFYTSQIIKIITDDATMQFYGNLALNCLRVISTGCSCVLLKKFSVRQLWITSGFCVIVGLFTISLFLHLSKIYPENKLFPLISITSIVINVIFFAVGLGPIPTIICGEMYPASVRGVGTALSSFACFFSIFVLIKILPSLFESLDSSVMFLLFGVLTTIGVVVSCFILPDTKNRTLKELETFYEKSTR